MADAVGALEIEDREIGMRLVDVGAEELVVDAGLDQDATQRRHRIVVRPRTGLLRLDARGEVGGIEPRQEARELGGVDRGAGASQRLRRPRLALRRIHGAFGRAVLEVEEPEQTVRHQHAVDRLGRIGGPQTEHADLLAAPGRHVPDRGARSLGASDRLALAGARAKAHEVEHAVLERAGAGHHRRPQQRREWRVLGFEDTAMSLADEPRELRHPPLRHQSIEELPVAAVEADEVDGRPRDRRIGDRTDTPRPFDVVGGGVVVRACRFRAALRLAVTLAVTTDRHAQYDEEQSLEMAHRKKKRASQ